MMSAALVAVAGGCGTAGVREVNKAALTQRISHTDDTSRRLARQTRKLLEQRSADYTVGPEDLLEISIFEWEIRNETRAVDVRVGESGTVALPVIGELTVGGLTVQQIKHLLEKRLKSDGILKEPRVSVAVKEFRSKRVAVVGAVEDPGVYTLRQNVTTLLSVLTLAGGTTDKAGQILYVIRAGEEKPPASEKQAPGEQERQQVIAIDLYELLEMGNLELNVVLRHGDVVNVPEAKQLFVVGFVRKPGGFPLKRPTSVLQAVALAGGLREREASPSHCILKRRSRFGEELIPIDLVAIAKGRAPNLYLMPDDILDVRQTLAKRLWLGFVDTFRDLFNIGYSLNR